MLTLLILIGIGYALRKAFKAAPKVIQAGREHPELLRFGAHLLKSLARR